MIRCWLNGSALQFVSIGQGKANGLTAAERCELERCRKLRAEATNVGRGAGKGAGKGTGANKGKGGGGGKGHKGSGKDRAVAAVQHTNNNASPDSTGTLPPSPTNEGQAKRNNAKRNGKGKGDCGRPTSAAAAPP